MLFGCSSSEATPTAPEDTTWTPRKWTLGYHRGEGRFRSITITNLHTRSQRSLSWGSLDETVDEMKTSPRFVPRAMR